MVDCLGKEINFVFTMIFLLFGAFFWFFSAVFVPFVAKKTIAAGRIIHLLAVFCFHMLKIHHFRVLIHNTLQEKASTTHFQPLLPW